MIITPLLLQLKIMKAKHPEKFFKFMNKLKRDNLKLYEKIKVHFLDDELIEEQPFEIVVPVKHKGRFLTAVFLIIGVSFFTIVFSYFFVLFGSFLYPASNVRLFCYTPNIILVDGGQGAFIPAFSRINIYNGSVLLFSDYLLEPYKSLEFALNTTFFRGERYDLSLQFNTKVMQAYCYAE